MDTQDSTLLPIELKYGQSFYFDISNEVKYWRIDITTITGQKYQIVNKSSLLPLVEFIDILDINSTTKRVTYKVNQTTFDNF